MVSRVHDHLSALECVVVFCIRKCIGILNYVRYHPLARVLSLYYPLMHSPKKGAAKDALKEAEAQLSAAKSKAAASAKVLSAANSKASAADSTIASAQKTLGQAEDRLAAATKKYQKEQKIAAEKKAKADKKVSCSTMYQRYWECCGETLGRNINCPYSCIYPQFTVSCRPRRRPRSKRRLPKRRRRK